MSALAPRNSHRNGDEPEWVESSDVVEPLPAWMWAPDFEEEDETTLQGKRVAQYSDLMSPNIEQEAPVDTPRQVQILDESQVLPREAPLATVRLNQPFAENALKPQHSQEPISTRNIAYDRERLSPLLVTLLDESAVLPGEASFATVLSDQRTQAYSPISEFLVKTKLSLKQLVLAMLALVSVMALAMIVLVRTTSSGLGTVSSAPPPNTLNTTSQSVLISNSQGNVSGSVNPTQPVATAEEKPSVAEAKLSAGSNSNSSLKATASDAKSGAVRQETVREVNPVGERVTLRKERDLEGTKQVDSVSRKALKKPEVANTPHASVKSQRLEPANKPATRQSAAPVTVEKVESKTPPTAGGEERPRTVVRKPSP